MDDIVEKIDSNTIKITSSVEKIISIGDVEIQLKALLEKRQYFLECASSLDNEIETLQAHLIEADKLGVKGSVALSDEAVINA